MKKVILLLPLFLLIVEVFAQNLTPVTNYYGKWGFINSEGDTIIKCQYDKASYFSEGLALVQNNVKYKLIDKNGNLLEKNKYQYNNSIVYNIETWEDGLPKIIDIWDCKFIDEKGNIKLELPYRSASNFYEGKATVYKDDKFNYINTKGELIGDWESILNEPKCVYNGDKYALVDSKNELITDFIFEDSFYFYDDIATVGKKRPGEFYKYKYGLINSKGELLIDYIYETPLYFDNNIAVAFLNNNAFLINTKGEKKTKAYNDLTFISTNKYLAQKDDKYFIIDSLDNIVSKEYPFLSNKYEGFVAYKKDNKYGIIDTLDNQILNNEYDEITDFWDGFAFAGKIDESGEIKYALINKKGEILTDFKYNTYSYIYNGLIKVGIHEDESIYDYLYGFIDTLGNEIIKCKYNYADDFYDDYSIVEIYDDDYYYLYGLIDKTGKEILKPEFDNVGQVGDGLIPVSKDYLYGYMDLNGNLIIDYQYSYAYKFAEGKALVGNYDYDTYEYDYFYIDKNNNRLSTNKIYSSYDYYEGRAITYYEYDENDDFYGYEYDENFEKLDNYANYSNDTSSNYQDGYNVVEDWNYDEGDYMYDSQSFDIDDENYYEDYYGYDYRYNILDENGKLLTETEFDYCSYFSFQDLAVVQIKDKKGYLKSCYIDKTGDIPFVPNYPIAYFSELPILKITKDTYTYYYALGNENGEIISDIYNAIYPFVNGFAIVINSENQYSFINKSGEQIGDFYYNVENFENGKAKVYKDYQIAYIDTEGKIVTPFKYDIIEKTPNYSVASFGEKYLLIDKEDNIIDNIFDKITIHNDKIAILERDNFKGFYNSDDNSTTILNDCESLEKFPAKASISGKYGYLDENFNWIVAPEYDYISDFENGIATVAKDGKTNTINLNGQLQSENWVWSEEVEYFTIKSMNFIKYQNKFALIDADKNKVGNWYYFIDQHNDNVIVKKNDLYYTINYDKENNSEILEEYYGFTTNLFPYGEYVNNEYKYGYVDEDYNVVIDYQYDYAYNFNEGVAVIEEYGDYYDYKYFIINENGEKINNEIYEYASNCSEGLICVQKNGNYGYIDKNGNTVIDFKYYYAYPFDDGLAYVQDENWNGYYIDKNGEVVFELNNMYVESFGGELGIVYQYDNDYNYIYAFVNRKGEIVSQWYDKIERVNDDLYIININTKAALFSSSGEMISKWYKSIIFDYYYDEITAVSDDKITFLKNDGEEVSEDERKEILNFNYYFNEGLAQFKILGENNYYQYGFIDENANIIIQPIYSYVYDFVNGFSIVEKYTSNNYNYSYSIINKKGEELIDWYDYITQLNDNLFQIEKNGKYSILNNKMEQICDWTKTLLTTNDNYLIVQEDNQFKIIDLEGNYITDKNIFKEIISKKFTFSDNYAVFSNYNSRIGDYQYGVLNSEGEIVINPFYDYIGNFNEGLAVAMKYDNDYYSQYGYINTEGNVVIDFQFEYAYDFHQGMAIVGKYNDETWETNYGFINTSGDLVVDYQYYLCNDFKDGIAIVQKRFDYNIMMSCIDLSGKEFQNWYEIILDFKDDYALALKYDKFVLLDKTGNEINEADKIKQRLLSDFNYTNGFAKVTKSNSYYYEPKTVLINQNGETISDWFISIGDFSEEGLAVVELDLDYDGYSEYGYINESGKLVIDIQFAWADKFKAGTALIGVPSSYYSYKYGIIDTEGDYIIDPIYDELRNFSENTAVAAQTNENDYYSYKYGMIDKSGKQILDYKFDYLGDLHSGLAVTYKYNPDNYTYKYGYINKKGKLKIDYQFDYASDFSASGIAIVGMDDDNDYYYDYGYINTKGKLISECIYEEVSDFFGNYGIVKKEIDGIYKSAFIDKTGNIASEWYDLLYNFSDGYALILNENKLKLIDESFNLIDDQSLLENYLIENFEFFDGLSLIKKNKLYGYINKKGEIIIEFKFDYADNFYYGSAYVEIDYTGYYLSTDGTLTPAYDDYYDDYEDWW